MSPKNQPLEFLLKMTPNTCLIQPIKQSHPERTDPRPFFAKRNPAKWVFPKMGVPQNGWFIMENPIKMDDLGVPLFLETLKSFTLHPWKNMTCDLRNMWSQNDDFQSWTCCSENLRFNPFVLRFSSSLCHAEETHHPKMDSSGFEFLINICHQTWSPLFFGGE